MTKVIHDEEQYQPSVAPAKIVGACAPSRGQFLLLLIGKQEHWRVNHLSFHAQLLNGHVIIETDHTERLTPVLIEAGIRVKDMLSDSDADRLETAPSAA